MNFIKRNGRYHLRVTCKTCPKVKFVQKSAIATDNGLCLSCTAKDRNQKSRGRYLLNRNTSFFREQTLQSVYWAGFLAADGCIRDSGVVSIKLKRSDEERLWAFIKDTNFEGSVKPSGLKACHVSVMSHEWKQDLHSLYGIGPRKTSTLRPPRLRKEEHIAAFIIGYIDGDGSIRCPGKRRDLRISIAGTEPMLGWIKKHFDRWKTPGRAKRSILPKKGVFEFVVYGRRAFEILTHLSQLPIHKMARKWDVVVNYRNRKGCS